MNCLLNVSNSRTKAAVVIATTTKTTKTTAVVTATEIKAKRFTVTPPVITSHSWSLSPRSKSLILIRPLIVIECVSTVFTVMASKSGNAQTLVISVCKTGLAGCIVLAVFICTSILQEKKRK